jgi:hypothetical protein
MHFDVDMDDVRARVRKTIAFAGVVVLHGIVFVAISKIAPPRPKHPNEFTSALFLVEPRKRKSINPTLQKSRQQVSVPADPSVRVNEAPSAPRAIAPIDWSAERERAAEQEAARQYAEPAERPLISKPKAMELPKRKIEHKPGDTQRFDDGEIITWVSENCYVTNLPPVMPRLDSNAINMQCRMTGRPPIVDGFDHIKPKYLRKEGEAPAKPKSLFTGDTIECDYSSTVCEHGTR